MDVTNITSKDCADLVQKFDIWYSLNLIVDDQIVFRKQPTKEELRAYFDAKKKFGPEAAE